ncbi:MAG: radical SAM protein [bacterium]|nr:radical SAM protein [bacterium]
MNVRHAIRMGLGAASHKLTGRRCPLNVMVSVTNRCPSNCSYCQIPQRKQREMTTDEITSMIDELAQNGCARIGFWGGEPLLRDDIGDIVSRAKKRGLYVTMDTNGYLVRDTLDIVKRLDHLVISLDGPENIHDTNREPGSFEKAMKALELVIGTVPVWTLSVLTRHSNNALHWITDLASKRGFQASFQVLHHNEFLGRGHDELMPSNNEYQAIIRELYLLKKAGLPIINSFNYLRYVYSWGDYRISKHPGRHRNIACLARQLYCNVDTDGSLYPCSLLVDEVPAPNMLDNGFMAAFESISPLPCESCLATCFIEYNHLFALNPATIIDWVKNMSFKSF